MTSIPVSDFTSSPSAKFDQMGDKYSGSIVSMTERAQTDPVTGATKTFADGSPRMQWVFTIEQPNGEAVTLYARGGRAKSISAGTGESMLSAIGLAVREAGASTIDAGGQLAVAFTGLGEERKGMNPMKLYTAQYRPPTPRTESVSAADLFDDSPF